MAEMTPPPPDSSPDLGDDELWEPEIEAEPPARAAKLRVASSRPVVRVVAHKMHEAVAATAAAIGHPTLGDPMLFQRSHELVVVLGAPPDGETRAPVVEDTPIVRSLTAAALHPRLCERVEFQKFSPPTEKAIRAAQQRQREPAEWQTCAPSPQLIASLLAIGEWPVIRRLSGVIETPAMRPDGTVLDVPGYDEATRSLYIPNANYLPVAATPSHSDAVIAYAKLRDVFADFPYVTESHRAATIAAVLTLLARPAIRGSVPCWLFDASAARSGKSLQTDVISLIATGRPASRCTYPENDEELEKVLASYALAGVRIIPLDNVARPFGGAPLDKCITAVDQVDLRVLGSSEIRTLPWVAVVLASGNNVRCRGDMLARVLSPRIESPLDNPERRTDVTHPDLREWVRANRPELVHAALTLLRAYTAAGSPAQDCPRWGGFEAWSRLVPQALVWVGAPDPMGARRGLEGDDDPIRVAEHALISGWERLQRAIDPAGLTIKAALGILYPTRHHGEDVPPDGYDDIREAIEELTPARPGLAPSSKHLGEALRRLRARPVAGHKLVGDRGRGDIVRWRVLPVQR